MVDLLLKKNIIYKFDVTWVHSFYKVYNSVVYGHVLGRHSRSPLTHRLTQSTF